ncbi:hypothetical protein AV530_011428 [Patagioenas fasciata monilis]|uniref:Uncharacterized protein n=1 Tax=Patagioenas fasciata monilis TaxID=372326 RepID=A0A1V4KPE2_PATFA|nr:hypothetical protein AV530_011428 [Patagioenas fasciata monilis]
MLPTKRTGFEKHCHRQVMPRRNQEQGEAPHKHLEKQKRCPEIPTRIGVCLSTWGRRGLKTSRSSVRDFNTKLSHPRRA